MIPLASNVHELNFDDLVEVGRAQLPVVAPAWTDHNLHDPGVTLIELLAWLADTQIYSLSRNRRDERQAMAALFRQRDIGPVAAEGALWASARPRSKIEIARDSGAEAVGARLPTFEVETAVTLLPVELTKILLVSAAGVVDATAVNLGRLTSFSPFGAHPGAKTAMVLELEGALDASARLGLGFQLQFESEPAREGLGGVNAYYAGENGPEFELTTLADTSWGLQHSGVMVLSLPADVEGDRHRIILRPKLPTALLPPVIHVGVNVVPVRQKFTCAPITEPAWGSGEPHQCYAIDITERLGALRLSDAWRWRPLWSDAAAGPLTVRFDGESKEKWSAGALSEADPDSLVFALDEDIEAGRLTLAFGNGVNGRKPAAGATLDVELALSCGEAGNFAAQASWRVAGADIAFENRFPITGGEDPPDIDSLLGRAQAWVAERRPLATNSQIETAAKDLPAAYGVRAARVIEGWEPGRRVPKTINTRTLVVSRQAPELTRPEGPVETEAWTAAVARRLTPRLALGERLIVTSPRYRRFRLRVAFATAPGQSRATVEAKVRSALEARLNPFSDDAQAWRMGEPVRAREIAGWLRRIPGVAGAPQVLLIDERGPAVGGELRLGKADLPWMAGLEVTSAGSGAGS